MPTVPKYGQPRVGQAPLPGIRMGVQAPLEAFGGGESAAQVTGAARGLEHDIARNMERGFQEANDLAVTEAKVKLDQTAMDMDRNARNVRGKDSFALPGKITQDYSRATQDIEKSLTNDVQKQAFRRIAQDRGLRLNSSINDHVARERFTYDESVTKALLATAEDRGKTYYDNPEEVEDAIADSMGAIAKHAERNGLAPEVKGIMERETRSRIVSGVVEQYIANGRAGEGKRYFDEQVKAGNLTGDDQERLAKVVESGKVNDDARQIASELGNAHPTQEAALQALEARNVKDTKTYDEAKRRIRERFADKRQADREEQEARFNSFHDLIRQQPEADFDLLVPPQSERGLTAHQSEALRDLHATLRRKDKIITDRDTFYELSLMAANDPKRFSKLNLREYSAKLDQEDFESFVKAQSNPDEVGGFMTEHQMIDKVLLEAGVDTSPKPGSEDAKTLAGFSFLANRTLKAEKERLGKKKLSAEESESIVKGLWEQARATNTGFFGGVTKGKTLKPGADNIVFSIRQISDVDRNEIVSRYKAKRGATPTDDEILDIYNRTVTSGAGQ